MCSRVGRVDLGSALPCFASGIVVAKAPKTEANTNARIGALPGWRVGVLRILVGAGLDEEDDLESLLVELEGGSVLAVSKKDACLAHESDGMTWVLLEDAVVDSLCSLVVGSVGSVDGLCELVDVVGGIDGLGLVEVGDNVTGKGVLGLEVCEVLVLCILENLLGGGRGAL